MTLGALFLSSLALALPGPAPDNDPRLFDDYEAMVKRLAEAPAWAVDSAKTEADSDGRGGTTHYAFRFERPGRFRLEIRADPKDSPPLLVLVGDGKTVVTYHAARNIYAEAPFYDLIETLDNGPIVSDELGGSLIDALVRPDLVAIVKDRVRDAVLLGCETHDGLALRHYRLDWRGDDEELWIGPDAEPLLRKLIRTQRVPESGGKEYTVVTTTVLSWTINPPADPAAFQFKPPAGARKVPDLVEALLDDDPDQPD